MNISKLGTHNNEGVAVLFQHTVSRSNVVVNLTSACDGQEAHGPTKVLLTLDYYASIPERTTAVHIRRRCHLARLD
jgi:hypothetical protein